MYSIRCPILLFMAIVCFPHAATCQPINPGLFKTLDVSDGLPQSFISGLAQDSSGFIWIGTRDGLARYDGKKFKIFRHVPGDATSLADNIVSWLFLDSQDRLWIIYEAGDVDVLSTATQQLNHLTRNPRYRLIFAKVKAGNSITEDAKGNIWLLRSDGGVMICNLNDQTIHHYSDTALGLNTNKIAGISVKNGNIMLITDTALITINDEKKFLQVVPYTFSNPHLYNPGMKWKDAQSISRKTGDVIIRDEGRLIIYSNDTKLFNVLELSKGKKPLIHFMTQDRLGNIFFDYDNETYFLSAKNELTLWQPKKDSVALGPISMIIDRSGVLWLGGNGFGIQLFDLRLSHLSGSAYKKSFHEDVLQQYLHVPAAEIKNTFLYNMQTYRFRWFQGNDGKIWLSKSGKDPVEAPQLIYYKNGHIEQPLWHYSDTTTNNHINTNAVALSKSGKLWGMDYFLRPVYFDTLTHAVTVYPSITSANFEYTYSVNSLLIDGEDTFWISTALNGLYCYNKKTSKITQYLYSELPGALPTNQLMNLVRDPFDANVFWIGSLGGGLIKFNKVSGKCRVYTTNEGLPNNTVYAVAVDPRGILWCSGNKGIFSFNSKTGAVRSFTSKDGLPGDEFNRYHFMSLPDNRLVFGGVDGYTAFDPLSISDDSFHPFIALTGLRINNIPADFGYPASPFKAAINSLQEIKLSYDQNFISFEFAALQYNITEKIQYRYMLEGIDNSWVNAGNDNVATYTNINPGHYTFQINATNTAGKWSTHIKSLLVVIEPPFWRTGWFTTLWVLALAGIIYFIVQYRIKDVRKEEQQKAAFEREASELKAQALRAQMNPHFIFNCLNSIKALIQEDNKLQAVTYLTTFSKLIRNQLNNAEREISLYEELETCKLYTQLEALRFGSKIICEFKIQEGVDTHSLRVPPLILQPFIENSIWHGILPKDGGKVTVSVSEEESLIKCVIDDNGIGRDKSLLNKAQKSSTYQSKGMKLVQNRLGLHNTIYNQASSIELIDKTDQNGYSLGTQVIVKFKKAA